MQLREAMDGEAQRRGKWHSTLKISSSHLRKLIVIFLCLPFTKLVVKLIQFTQQPAANMSAQHHQLIGLPNQASSKLIVACNRGGHTKLPQQARPCLAAFDEHGELEPLVGCMDVFAKCPGEDCGRYSKGRLQLGQRRNSAAIPTQTKRPPAASACIAHKSNY